MKTICRLYSVPIALLPMEAREHDDEEGGHVEEEEAGEEGAQPGEREQYGADQGEMEHGGGGLQGQYGDLVIYFATKVKCRLQGTFYSRKVVKSVFEPFYHDLR